MNKETIVLRWIQVCMLFAILMVMIGGITRLTDSGLSMSKWNLIMDVIPPLNEQEWSSTFEHYKEFPEYQHKNYNMSLDEFKVIYFWEFTHRLIGRLIGFLFIVPFLFFWYKGYLSGLIKRGLFFLFGLGALQGFMGWFMVKSGLIDNPYVSHYRLALHLLLAFLIITTGLWLIKALKFEIKSFSRLINPSLLARNKPLLVLMSLFVLQIMYGAFVAGLDAGRMYNTFPLMNGALLPQFPFTIEPSLLNFTENPGLVQFVHRSIAYLLFLSLTFLIYRAKKENNPLLSKRLSILLLLLSGQIILGIITLLSFVTVSTGVIHQMGGLFCWLYLSHIVMEEFYTNPKVIESNESYIDSKLHYRFNKQGE